MVDRIIEERICCKTEVYLASKQLAVLEARRKTLIENGNTAALKKVYTSIKDIRLRLGRINQRDLELGEKVRADARRSADYERESYLRKTLELEEYYTAAIEWLHRPADAKGVQETYWDRFIRGRVAAVLREGLIKSTCMDWQANFHAPQGKKSQEYLVYFKIF